MQHGEDLLTWSWPQYVLIGALLISYLMLNIMGKLPSMQSFKEFADIINSSGGNIILLSILTVWSIKLAMQFFYHLLSLSPEQFDKSNSIITAGITFVQGGLSGMFIGALIKTLTGGKANGTPPPPPAPENPVGGRQITVEAQPVVVTQPVAAVAQEQPDKKTP